MIKKVNDALFNTHVIPSDWRYSAAIVGLEKYLYNQNLEYEIKDEYFAFNQEDYYSGKISGICRGVLFIIVST